MSHLPPAPIASPHVPTKLQKETISMNTADGPIKATLILEGENRGQYKDEQNGTLFLTAEEWIRSVTLINEEPRF